MAPEPGHSIGGRLTWFGVIRQTQNCPCGPQSKKNRYTIVLARVHGETLVRRLMTNGKTGRLVADNPDYPAIDFKEGLDYRILGVVRYRIGEL